MRLVAAELLKLRRWSTLVLVGVTPLFQVLFGYLLIFTVLQLPNGGPEDELARQALLATLGPQFIVSSSLSTLASLGGALALVIGAMLSAREYGWRTITTLLTLGPRRLEVFAAKAVTLALVVVVIVVLTVAASALGATYVSTQPAGPSGDFPPVADVGVAIAVGCLILGTWAAIGYALGYLLRSTGLAIGLGLVYALVIETIVSGFAIFNDTFETISRALLGANAAALAASFGPELPDEFGVISITPAVAAAVVTAYLVVALAAAGLVFVRRDVT